MTTTTATGATSAAAPLTRTQPAPASSRWLLHLLLILFSVLMLFPFVLMLFVSLLPFDAFLARDFALSNLTLANYPETFRAVPFGRYYLNSIIVTAATVFLRLLVGSLAAFAFARLRFKGREILFTAFLATLMIPAAVTLIPRFLIVKELGWYNEYAGLIVPGVFSALAIFLMRQYYRGIPLDYDEAARMDGASSLRIWWQVIVPLSTPVLGTLLILSYNEVWNDFLWPLVNTSTNEMRTIPIGLSYFVGQYSTAWNLLMAGGVIALLPILIVYVLAQNSFVKGIALTGLGGR
ncbi:MAG: carbohydrate ABC transporter permease [Caldilineaceae bacterium]